MGPSQDGKGRTDGQGMAHTGAANASCHGERAVSIQSDCAMPSEAPRSRPRTQVRHGEHGLAEAEVLGEEAAGDEGRTAGAIRSGRW